MPKKKISVDRTPPERTERVGGTAPTLDIADTRVSMTQSLRAQKAPQPDFSGDRDDFFAFPPDLSDLVPPQDLQDTPILKVLGPIPFPRSGFPLMGLLATLYEHVAKDAARATATNAHTTSDTSAADA